MSFVNYITNFALRAFSLLPSGAKIAIYRSLGASIGREVEIGIGSIIIPFSRDFSTIVIRDRVIIKDDVRILAKRLFLDENSQIKEKTKIWGQSEFRTGRFAYIDQHCFFDLRRDITIGDHTGIGANSWFYTHGIWNSVLDGAPSNLGPITVGNGVWIGSNAFVLPGHTIGDGAIVAGRAVVTKDVAADTVVAGNPARVLARTSEKTRAYSPDEKQRLLACMVRDFLDVYDFRVTGIHDEKDRISFTLGKDTALYLADATGFDPAADGISILISLSVPPAVRAAADAAGVAWLAPGEKEHGQTLNGNARLMVQFFGNYGITFTSTGPA